MKKSIFFIILFAIINVAYSQDTKDQVTGLVTDFNQEPLPLVNIIIKNTNNGTKTDEFGRYELVASSGDTLLFTYIGIQSYQVEVRKIPSVINVSLQRNNIQLEEVEIKARRLRTEAQLLKEYPVNQNLVKTSWGILDKERFSGSMHIIDGNKLINVGTSFLSSLKAFVPNMIVKDDKVYLSKLAYTSNPTALFEVDGIIYVTAPTFLLSSDIERVAILERSSAISRYGPSGVGGVIIINTKGQAALDELGVDRSYEKKILLDSMILEASSYEDYVLFTSAYLSPIKRTRKKKKAWAIHETQKQNELDNPYYYLDVYDFLLSRWKNSHEATVLFKEIMNRFQNNVEVLKALAYLQEQVGNYKSALSIYLKILTQKPNDAQSHRDVANAFVELEDYKNALIRYNWFLTSTSHLTSTPFDSYGQDLLMTTEILNILQRYGNELVDSFDVKDVNEIYTGTRLVFDWNNPNAKFDLQIITPDRYYDTWQNYIENGAQDSLIEPRYYSKQFFIDNEIKGEWTINLNYHGNQSDDPTYMKLSIFRDYGLPSQSLKIRVYRLSEENNKIKLFELIQQ